MGRGIASVNYESVCKCENPNIIKRGYVGGFKKIPIYYCYNCRHQFKSKSPKWEALANQRAENTTPENKE